MSYRDGLGPRWRQACDEIELLRGRAERLPAWARRRAPKGLRARLDAAPEPSWFDPAQLAEIERAEAALAELRAALDEIEAFAAEGERPRAEAPDLEPYYTEPLSSSSFDPSVARAFLAEGEETRRQLAPYRAEFRRRAQSCFVASFAHESVPYSLRFEQSFDVEAQGVMPGQSFTLATSVPLACPEFRLLPQTGFDDLLQALRLQKSHKVGHEAFDVMFRVVGDAPCVGLLGPPVRGPLLAMGRVDVPHLDVADGAARLGWNAPPTGTMFEAAIRALGALRAAAGARN